MSKEELEKEANGYADKHAFRVPYDGSNKFYDDVDFKASKEGYLAGAEPREKRIEELIALINAERERQEKCDDVHLRTIAELEKENAELKADNDARKFAMAMSENVEKQLREENAKLKEELGNYQKGMFDEIEKRDIKLTKAKKLLQFVSEYEDMTCYADELEEIKQFLKECK